MNQKEFKELLQHCRRLESKTEILIYIESLNLSKQQKHKLTMLAIEKLLDMKFDNAMTAKEKREVEKVRTSYYILKLAYGEGLPIYDN